MCIGLFLGKPLGRKQLPVGGNEQHLCGPPGSRRWGTVLSVYLEMVALDVTDDGLNGRAGFVWVAALRGWGRLIGRSLF